MHFKVVCTDIDGTLLDANRALSARTIAAIRQLPPGTPVILASSRMPRAMRHLQAELGILDHPLICYNGGYILDYSAESPTVLHSSMIPAALCREIVQHSTAQGIHASLYQADDWFVPAHDQWAAREQNNTRTAPELAYLHAVVARWEEAGTGAHKIMCMGEPEGIDQIVAALSGSGLNLYRSKPTYLEIAAGSMNKATALELLLSQRYAHTLEEVIAFGDNYNDIEMLLAVGIGVAVGNANEEVKRIARHITDPGKEDGVAKALELWSAPR